MMIERTARRILAGSILILFATFSQSQAEDYHVAPAGDDSAVGTTDEPWKTIQSAIDKAIPGDTIHVHEGTYHESLAFNKSGNAESGPITLTKFGKDEVVLDGTDNKDVSPMIEIAGQSFININGLDICNFKTEKPNETPVGIMVSGACTEITISNCKIHDIASLAKLNKQLSGRDAHGIAVYGDGATPISQLKIVGNRLYDLTLGSSEALVVNGNVDGFEIRDNVVHDCDNIGIDCIGFEGTAAKGQIDQARNGVVVGNNVFNIATAKNPSYDGESSAAGIYVDGGRDVVIERNRTHNCDFGIEIASEHKGKITRKIVVRNNLIYNNLQSGLIIGGYNKKSTGDAEDCLIINNSFFNNDTKREGDEWGQICLQFRVSNCSFINNILYHDMSKKDGSNVFVVHWNETGKNNTFNYNQFYGPGDPVWVLNDNWIDDWEDYLDHKASGTQEAFGDPMFNTNSVTRKDWLLKKNSPCIESGDPNAKNVGEKDFFGNKRKVGIAVDRGAIESDLGNK